MEHKNMLDYIKRVLENMPADWFNLTTHRLDIYNEQQAKTEFIEEFEALFNANDASADSLRALPTAYDYIRLGHPLSCVLEWVVANLNDLNPKNVISFSSKTVPMIAILRKNLLENKRTRFVYTGELPEIFDAKALETVYGFNFELKKVDDISELNNDSFDGSTVFVSHQDDLDNLPLSSAIDFYIGLHTHLGSIILVSAENDQYISEIQHVRRRETIAMTPANSLDALKLLLDKSLVHIVKSDIEGDKQKVHAAIKEITHASTKPLVASSGLSMQYAIMMGLIDHALENHPGKAIRFVVPPNCYGGTNDQARRVAATRDDVSVVDLPVDGLNDMVSSTHQVLDQIAKEDAIPYIIAEIPTNPRVEVPDLIKLKEALSAERKTINGDVAVDPVFILDQTFCPNVNFLGDGQILSSVRTIAYVSGSKFPSGGKCTAGYCVGNQLTKNLIEKIDKHLTLCDNRARNLQMSILAKQLPSMIQRIADAYKNTREFVNFIQEKLPTAKINFVSEELAEQGFTPSVFSLDLPTKGETDEERELYKRSLNLKLINKMITEIPNESKYCVSYGQLKGCYWTIPATSTQGTTKEGDKDYIARVAVSPDLDLELHKKVFADFVAEI